MAQRVHAVLRRYDEPTGRGDRLVYADLLLDTRTREVWRDGMAVTLTPTEYRLLHYLLVNARQVITRDQLITSVWGDVGGANASVLETYVHYLRRKLAPTGPPLIHTVRGVGYTLRTAVLAQAEGVVEELAPRKAPLGHPVLREQVLAPVVEDPVADVAGWWAVDLVPAWSA